jgi:hypothetical protein
VIVETVDFRRAIAACLPHAVALHPVLRIDNTGDGHVLTVSASSGSSIAHALVSVVEDRYRQPWTVHLPPAHAKELLALFKVEEGKVKPQDDEVGPSLLLELLDITEGPVETPAGTTEVIDPTPTRFLQVSILTDALPGFGQVGKQARWPVLPEGSDDGIDSPEGTLRDLQTAVLHGAPMRTSGRVVDMGDDVVPDRGQLVVGRQVSMFDEARKAYKRRLIATQTHGARPLVLVEIGPMFLGAFTPGRLGTDDRDELARHRESWAHRFDMLRLPDGEV